MRSAPRRAQHSSRFWGFPMSSCWAPGSYPAHHRQSALHSDGVALDVLRAVLAARFKTEPLAPNFGERGVLAIAHCPDALALGGSACIDR